MHRFLGQQWVVFHVLLKEVSDWNHLAPSPLLQVNSNQTKNKTLQLPFKWSSHIFWSVIFAKYFGIFKTWFLHFALLITKQGFLRYIASAWFKLLFKWKPLKCQYENASALKLLLLLNLINSAFFFNCNYIHCKCIILWISRTNFVELFQSIACKWLTENNTDSIPHIYRLRNF